MSDPAAEILRQAARLNLDDSRLQGSVVHLAEDKDVLVTGDLHGHRDNLTKIIRWANLQKDCSRRLVLQEIIHGPPDARSGHDRSIEVLIRAARLKIQYPEQIVILLSNHDVAEITGNEITRGGQPSCKSFAEGVKFAYREAAAEMTDALHEFLTSLPLAARCPGNVMISHSLPQTTETLKACLEVLDRPYTLSDFVRGQPVYQWVWGRKFPPEHVDELARKLGVAFFIIGHLHPSDGCEWLGPNAVTLSSDHDRGCVMRFDSGTSLDLASAKASVIQISNLR